MQYVDPGAGSMLLQILSAGLVAFLLSLSRVRHGLSAFFRRVFHRSR